MKTLSVFALGLLLLTVHAAADVLIYKNKITATRTGDGVTEKTPVTGYTIIDPEAASIPIMVWANPRTKTFRYVFLFDTQADALTGAKAAELTVISQARTWDDSGFSRVDIVTMKGVNVPPMDIGTFTQWTIPKTMSWIGRSILPGNNDSTILEESTGTLTIDLNLCRLSNGFLDNPQAAATRLGQSLIAQGYTQL
jgi:hypothetical protein